MVTVWGVALGDEVRGYMNKNKLTLEKLFFCNHFIYKLILILIAFLHGYEI